MLVKEDKVTNQSDLPYRGDWFLQIEMRVSWYLVPKEIEIEIEGTTKSTSN